MKIVLIQIINFTILCFLSLMALEAWWKVCLFGVAAIIVTSLLGIRYKESAVTLAAGTLPLLWLGSLIVIVIGGMTGFNIG